ncbi:hypothetical protein PhCBS80983_g03542 [Powellomyces hirtus]|uniref:H/ACA ribonucleoprotein complex non-core subunit NAF1 n=1 Tax=Powellomyces hirtus TaxID=109895 RepID=A0A507E438_9FUNG|nr:hypothetical protein PhCBS80983_g03542 [Powellomyces hirtus]
MNWIDKILSSVVHSGGEGLDATNSDALPATAVSPVVPQTAHSPAVADSPSTRDSEETRGDPLFVVDTRPSVENISADYHDIEQYHESLPFSQGEEPMLKREALVEDSVKVELSLPQMKDGEFVLKREALVEEIVMARTAMDNAAANLEDISDEEGQLDDVGEKNTAIAEVHEEKELNIKPASGPADAVSADANTGDGEAQLEDISDEEGQLQDTDEKTELQMILGSGVAVDSLGQVTTAVEVKESLDALGSTSAPGEIKAEESLVNIETITNVDVEIKKEEKEGTKTEADDATKSDFEFSDSDSSDSDSDSEVNAPKLTFAQRERLLQSIDANPEDPADNPQSLRTKNEVATLPPVNPVTEPIPANAPIVPIGKIHSTVNDILIIQTPADVDPERALDADTVLVTEERKPIGKIFETFGPVTRPFYSVRFNTAAEIAALELPLGTNVFVPRAPGLEKVVFTRVLKAMKGSDASNINDEEISADELEFSDDEKEMEYRRQRKLARKRKRAADDGDDDDDVHDDPPDQLADSAEYLLNGRPQHNAAGRGSFRGQNGRGGRGGRGGSDRGARGGAYHMSDRVPQPNRHVHDGGNGQYANSGRGSGYTRGRGGPNATRGGSWSGAQQQQPYQQQRSNDYPPRQPQQPHYNQPYGHQQQQFYPPQQQQSFPGFQQQAPGNFQPQGGYSPAQVAMAAFNILQQQQQGQPQGQFNSASQQGGAPGGFDLAGMMGLMQGVMQTQAFQQQHQQQQQQQQQQQYRYTPSMSNQPPAGASAPNALQPPPPSSQQGQQGQQQRDPSM